MHCFTKLRWLRSALIATVLLAGFVNISRSQNVYDVSLTQILCPVGQYLTEEAQQYPYVVVTNMGTHVINAIDVYYRIDDGAEVLRHVEPVILNQGETRNVIFPQVTLPEGEHTFTARVNISNDITDENPVDNQLQSQFIVAGGDIMIQGILAPSGSACNFDSIQPVVVVKNNGQVDIGSFDISFFLNEEEQEQIHWEGMLLPGQTVNLSFSKVFPETGVHNFSFYADAPNGSSDAEPDNNGMETGYSITRGNTIQVTITTDQNSWQNSFEILNSMSQVVVSETNLPENEILVYTYCLPAGNYTFVIYDSNGNGMCQGPQQDGWYNVTNLSTGSSIADACNFQWDASHPFQIINPYGAPVVGFLFDKLEACSSYYQFTSNVVSSVPVFSYSWNFGDGGVSTLQNPVHVYAESGIYTISLTAISNYGQGSYTCEQCLVVDVAEGPAVTDGFSCGPGAVNLSAGTATEDIYWFVNQSQTEAFHLGNTYTTPNLNSTATYWVEKTSTNPHQYFGMFDNTGPGGYFGWNITRTLQFDAYSDVTIVSAKVYAQGAGNRTFTLYNADNVQIDQKNIYIEAGEHRIDLNFQLLQGYGYSIAVSQQNNLAYTGDYNGPSYAYPYMIDDLIALTGNNYSSSFYYFLYDIEVFAGFSDVCHSGRVPITAHIQYPDAGLPPESICCIENPCFLVAAPGYAQYQWSLFNPYQTLQTSFPGVYTVTVTDEFGCTAMGTTNLEILEPGSLTIDSGSASSGNNGWANAIVTGGNPPFIFSWSNGATSASISDLAPGTYSVTVSDAAGCELTGETEISVGVKPIQSDLVRVFPNPSNGRFEVSVSGEEIIGIEVYDITGFAVLKCTHTGPIAVTDISTLPDGVYVLRIVTPSGSHTQKIVKR